MTETATVHRYPKDGFDLSNAVQRKDLYMAMFNIFKYSTSAQAKLNVLNQPSKIKVQCSYSLLITRTTQLKKS